MELGIDAGRFDRSLVRDESLGAAEGVVGHPAEKIGQRRRQRVPMEAGIEPYGVRRFQCHDVAEGEMQIAAVFMTNRIGQLILVEIDDRRQPAHACRCQPSEFRQIEHRRGEEDVPLFGGFACNLVGEGCRGVPHSPLPMMPREGEERPRVAAAGHPAF